MTRDASIAPEPLRVGYILKMFPRLSETFILNELLQLEASGVEASVFSLMHPDDGRFHGRLGELQLAARYFPREKPETYWKRIQEAPEELVPPMSRWETAARFLRQWGIPKDLELLLRAVAIAVEVQSRGVQHLHAHFATVATHMAALVNILIDVPFSFTAHAKDIYRETVNRDLYADLVRRAAFNVTVSDFNRAYLLENMPSLDEDKVIRLYNGIDLSFFDAVPARSPRETPHLVSVGRLVPKKGFHHLLPALARLQERGQPFRATIIGDGPERLRLEALQRELTLQRCVTPAGPLPQEEVRATLADADQMVLPCVRDADGNQDALPTVLLEALALDVPIVSTRLSGIPEIVGEEAGTLVGPGDESGLADAIVELHERCRQGRREPGVGRRRAERLFDLRQNVATLKGLFQKSAQA